MVQEVLGFPLIQETRKVLAVQEIQCPLLIPRDQLVLMVLMVPADQHHPVVLQDLVVLMVLEDQVDH